MNIIEKIAITYPLNRMYVPSGWYVAKNNLICANPSIINEAEHEDLRFLIRENFFSSCILYAYSNHILNNGTSVRGVVDVYCSLSEEETGAGGIVYNGVDYTITLSLFKGKAGNTFFALERECNDSIKMIGIVNYMMTFFSRVMLEKMENEGLDADFDKMVEI